MEQEEGEEEEEEEEEEDQDNPHSELEELEDHDLTELNNLEDHPVITLADANLMDQHHHHHHEHTVVSSIDHSTNTVTLVNAAILQPVDSSTDPMQEGTLNADQLPPGSTITLALVTQDSDDSLGPSMSSAACQTSLSLPPLL